MQECRKLVYFPMKSSCPGRPQHVNGLLANNLVGRDNKKKKQSLHGFGFWIMKRFWGDFKGFAVLLSTYFLLCCCGPRDPQELLKERLKTLHQPSSSRFLHPSKQMASCLETLMHCSSTVEKDWCGQKTVAPAAETRNGIFPKDFSPHS